jgi:hypothetical protein
VEIAANNTIPIAQSSWGFFCSLVLGAVPVLLQAICCQTLFSWAASLVALPPPEKWFSTGIAFRCGQG